MNLSRRGFLKLTTSIAALATMPVSAAFEKVKEFSGVTITHLKKPKVIKVMDLRFSLHKAYDCGEKRHAQVVMKDLGITYQQSTPQSIGDQWWFWNCESIPENLPEYLTDMDLDPMECIGFGLSKEDAEKIRDYKPVDNKND